MGTLPGFVGNASYYTKIESKSVEAPYYHQQDGVNREHIFMEDFEKQPLTEHLTELRSCLIISMVAVAICFAVSYYFVEDIGKWFFNPLFKVLPEKSSLIFTSFQEAFFFT